MATKTKKQAPLRRAVNWGREVPLIAGKLVLITVVTIVLGLLFSSIQSLGADWLRILITGAVIFCCLALFFSEGLNKGASDAGSSRQMDRLEKAGKELTAKEEASCYHPLKALCGALLLFAVPLLLAAYVAICAKEYTYVLQDLPTWVSGSYGSREDVIGPLGAYLRSAGTSVLDWVRVFVRLFILSFVNLFNDPQRMVFTVDRLTPLFVFLYPLAYTLGYLRGPAEYAKLEKQNKKAKKVAVRKQQRKKLADELVGTSNVPHYGHKREDEKPKKKELI
ncbi:MAG: hypothetical protein IKB82_07235 [Clostridia bacterium]|nr:hypothetical protein [Clostridia bacterium]